MKFRAALAYDHVGDIDQTISSLDKAVAAGYSVSTIRDTPDFDHLRHDARFKKLLRNP